MKHRKVLLTTIVAATLLAGCKSSLQLDAKIVDSSGRAIAGAELRLARPNFDWAYTETASQDGCLSAGGTVSAGSDTWQVNVSAAGYKPVFTQIESPEHHIILFTLASLSDGARSKSDAVATLSCDAH